MFGALNPYNSLSKQPFGGIIAQNWSFVFYSTSCLLIQSNIDENLLVNSMV